MIDFTAKRVLTFDCYGTLIDWETGILSTLQPILADHGVTADAERLLALHAELESAAERGPYTPYRQLLMTVIRGLGERLGFTPSAAEQSRFADAVGDWPPFADTRAALRALGRRFRLAIISNVDDDLFARTNQQLDVTFDWIVTAQQVKSYKPSPNSFREALARIGLPTAGPPRLPMPGRTSRYGTWRPWSHCRGPRKDHRIEREMTSTTIAGRGQA